MTRPTILILGAGDELIPLISLARESGCNVVVTDRSPQAPGLAVADEGVVVDGSNLEKILELARRHCISGITTRTEALLPVVSHICSEMNLPGPSAEVSELSVNKFLFRQRMSRAGLKTPAFFSPTTELEVAEGLASIRLPAVVKPVDYSGSTGVSLVDTPEAAVSAWRRAAIVSPSQKVIIEEQLFGREFSVETWSQDGKTHIAAITEKRIHDNGHCVETGHTIPASLTPTAAGTIATEVLRMAEAISLDNCLTHTEIMLTQEGDAVLIETGARPGGDLIGLRLVELATGISMNRIMLFLALGKQIEVPPSAHHAAAIRYITTYNHNRIKSHHTSLINHPHFVEYKALRDDDPGVLTSSADRLGYYLFRSYSPDDLNQTLQLFDES